MEKISEDVKESELKQATLREAYDKLSSEALSIYLMHLKWKDLETHFNSTRSSLESQLNELVERERAVKTRETELADINSVLDSEIDSKSKLLVAIESSAENRRKELERSDREIDSRTKRLDEIERLIKERGKELEANKRDVELLESAIRKKQRELDSQEKRINDKARDFEHLKIRLGDIERWSRQRSEEEGLVQGRLSKYREDLELVRRSLADHENRLRTCRDSVLELDGEIRLRGEVLLLIQDSIGKCSLELESNQRRLEPLQREFEMRKRMMISLKKSADEYSRDFEAREKRLEGLARTVEAANRESFGPESEEIRSILKKVEDCLEEAERREKSLVSFEKSVEECLVDLEKRETRFRERFDEFVLMRKEFDPTLNSNSNTKTNTNPHFSIVKTEQYFDGNNSVSNVPCFPSYQYCTTNGHFLQLLLTEQLKSHESRCNELFSVLRGSPDPARLVLEAVRGFYSNQGTGFELNIARSSSIFLLEKLKALSPEISSGVREEAKGLASDWKAKMAAARTVNHLEVVGFLQLRDSYRLQSDFSEDDIPTLVHFDQKIREECPFDLYISLPNEKSVDTKPVKNLTGIVPNGPNLIGKDLTQDDILTALQMPNPAKHVLGMVKGSFSLLWERGDQVSFEASFIKSYIFILEQILRNSPEIQIDVRVREDATKLAKEWRERIRANNDENCLEVLGILLFIAAYGLVSEFKEDDIADLLEIMSRDKHDLKHSRDLCLAIKIDVHIQNFIGNKKLLVAVRLACIFELTHKFSPVKLLSEFIEEVKSRSLRMSDKMKSVEEKDKATDIEINALRDAVKCVKDHNLGSKFSSENVTKRIALLEKIKKDRKHSAEFFQGVDEQEQLQICNKRKISTISIGEQQQKLQGNNKKKRLKKKTLTNDKTRDSKVSAKPVPRKIPNSLGQCA